MEDAAANLAWSGYGRCSVLSPSGMLNLCKTPRVAEPFPGLLNVFKVFGAQNAGTAAYRAMNCLTVSLQQRSYPSTFLSAICNLPLSCMSSNQKETCRRWPCWIKSNNLPVLFKTRYFLPLLFFVSVENDRCLFLYLFLPTPSAEQAVLRLQRRLQLLNIRRTVGV